MRELSQDNDTICALATAPGAGAIAVIRVSGDLSENIVRKIAPFLPQQLESHKIYYGFLLDGQSASPIDEVLISYFEKGRSFTSEKSFEISCHGGAVISQIVLRHLVEAGARPAMRGEFSYRAFMSGRIDMIQAESILSLVSSETELSARTSIRLLQGQLSKQILEMQNDLS